MAKKNVRTAAAKKNAKDSSSDEDDGARGQESPLAKKSKQPGRALVPPPSPTKAKGRPPAQVPPQMPIPARVTRAKKATAPEPAAEPLPPQPRANTRARARAQGQAEEAAQEEPVAPPARGRAATRGVGAAARARGAARKVASNRPSPAPSARDDEDDEPATPPPARARARAVQGGRGGARPARPDRRLPSSPVADDVADAQEHDDGEEDPPMPLGRRRIVRGRDIGRAISPAPRARSHSPMAVSPTHAPAARRRAGRSDRFARPMVTFEVEDETMQYASADEAPARGEHTFFRPCALRRRSVALRAKVFPTLSSSVCLAPWMPLMRLALHFELVMRLARTPRRVMDVFLRLCAFLSSGISCYHDSCQVARGQARPSVGGSTDRRGC